MAKLKRILLTDMQHWNGSAWVNLRARNLSLAHDDPGTIPLKWDEDPDLAHGVLLSTYSGNDIPNKQSGDINFENFKIDNPLGGPSYTLFHSLGSGLGDAASRKTTLIRYKTVCVVEDSGTEFPELSSDYSYFMIKSSFASNALVSGGPVGTQHSSSIDANLTFKFPIFQSAAGSHAYGAIEAMLSNKGNWEMRLLKDGGGGKPYIGQPTSLSLGTPSFTSAFTYPGDYGYGYVPVTISRMFSGLTTGAYELTARFKKNDDGNTTSWMDIPAEYDVTVQLTVGMATPDTLMIITNEADVSLTVTISTGTGI